MAKPYKNAAVVLPKELLRQLQQYHTGLLWIPKTEGFHRDRAELIRQLVGKGVKQTEIARLCGITDRRVRQIIRELSES